MTEQHPINLDSKTIHRLSNGYFDPRQEGVLYDSLNRIAQWGADQELEACLEHLFRRGFSDVDIFCLRAACRAARRPNPPSLKEQALAALNEIEDKMLGPTVQEKIIRKALEQLND
jgi:hypothetical protein